MNNEKHQFGFSFMNCMTGGQRVRSFWGRGNRDEALIDARTQAQVYARQYEQELNDKARARNRSMYAPFHISVQIVGYSFWR